MGDREPLEVCSFGPFTLDGRRRVLLKDGQAVALTSKGVEILLALVERAGDIVEKDELFRRVWPNQAVEEGNLTVNIAAIRKALGERAADHRYIATVPGRGYKFVAAVTTAVPPVDEGDGHGFASHSGVTRTAPFDQTTARHRPRGRTSLAVAAVVVLLALGFWWWSRAPSQPDADQLIQSLAVLPFRPLVATERDEALELGLADMVAIRLGNIQELIVRPASSVRRFDRPDRDPLAAGRALGVEAVLDGTIHRAGDRVRLTARLLRVRDGSSLWAGSFDGSATNMFEVEDSLSEKVARALRGELTRDEAQRLAKHDTHSVEAHRLYLLGRFHWNKLTPAAWHTSVEHFERAVLLDPSYARAYAGLSDAYASLASDERPDSDSRNRARMAAIKAVELDSGLPEGHVSLGRIKAYYDWDWKAAGRAFSHAVALNPASPDARREYGLYLAVVGRPEEAVAETRRALALDPISLPANFAVGWALISGRQYDDTLAHFRRSLDIDPRFTAAHHFIGLGYIGKRMYREAIPELQRALRLSDDSLLVIAELGFAYGAAGDIRESERLLSQLDEMRSKRYVSPYYEAVINAGLGRREQAFSQLEQAYRDRSRRLWALKVVPTWDHLRADPRFGDLLRRIGLPQ